MRFLVDASAPRSAAPVLRRMGHDAEDVRDAGMRSATDAVIAAYAKDTMRALVTRDFGFADIRNYPPSEYAGIVVLQLPDDATASRIVELLEAFVRQDWLAQLPGRLAIVEVWRVRFRQG